MANPLPRSFFNRPTLMVAQDLLGKSLVFQGVEGIITETEAYIGQDDPACHASRGKTPRNTVMFGPPGFSYVYFIYGMYHCLNVVTEEEGFPAAVLIRGIQLRSLSLNGPGKLCRHLAITRDNSGIDLTTHPSFYMKDTQLSLPFDSTPRIGISKGQNKLWRFVAK